MDIKATNVVWHNTSVKRDDREKMLKQKGILLWFTGLSGSGKSTVAVMLEQRLHDKGKLTYLLDGDNVRHGLNKDLGFSCEDRIENVRRIAEISKLFVDAGIITIATFISPFLEEREKVKRLLGDDFKEIYVDCPLEICENRDPKGIYKKARQGIIKDFTGIDSPYEKPLNPDMVIHTSVNSLEECTSQIINYLYKASSKK